MNAQTTRLNQKRTQRQIVLAAIVALGLGLDYSSCWATATSTSRIGEKFSFTLTFPSGTQGTNYFDGRADTNNTASINTNLTMFEVEDSLGHVQCLMYTYNGNTFFGWANGRCLTEDDTNPGADGYKKMVVHNGSQVGEMNYRATRSGGFHGSHTSTGSSWTFSPYQPMKEPFLYWTRGDAVGSLDRKSVV